MNAFEPRAMVAGASELDTRGLLKAGLPETSTLTN